jgi:hypothetical protein
MTTEPGYLPLGYWLEKNYPCFTDVKTKSPGTITLINPEPFDHQIQYPVPVTFYQDVQQEDFWEVGVRIFGYTLLHYRSLREGCRVNYHVNFDNERQKFAWKRVGRSRVAGHLPFETVSETFRDTVSELETMMSLTPYQRAGRNFGQAILRSSQEEDAFWTNSSLQQISVQEIFNHIARAPSSDEERAKLFMSLTNLISDAGNFHKTMIASVVASEEINGSSYIDRRKSLLIWNREMRNFMRQFQALLSVEYEIGHTVRLHKDQIAFELCRMMLWSPQSDVHSVADSNEYAALQNARNTPLICRQICCQLLADDRSSIFSRCCAEIMICALDSNEDLGGTERCKVLTKHMETLSSLRSFDIPDWTATLDEWIMFATQTRETIVRHDQLLSEQA